MDDLFGGILLALAFVAIAALALALALVVLAACAAITAVWALCVGIGMFCTEFATAIRERGGARRLPRAPEPAFELYVLNQLFADFRHSIEHAAAALADVRKELSAFADRWSDGPTLPLSIGAVVGGYVGTALAALVGGIFGVLVGLVVGAAWVASWALIWMLRAADSVRRRVRRASYECPTDHERFSLPVYVCPACGAEHARLVPGRWGIFKRECECRRTALPTTVINGRQRVPQQCPSGHPMSGFLGFAENLPIAIVGGPSSGKSTFLAGALIELDQPDAGVALEPLSESRDAYSRLVDPMRAGTPPIKTTDEGLPALVAEVRGSGRSRALYAYDVAGEVYGAEDKVRGLRFLARSAGIAMLIDPFSIPRVAGDHADELTSQAQHILPSSEDPLRVYERLVATLKEAGVDTHKMPLAVIIAKSDACGIDREIEEFAASAGEGRGARAWLEANGAGNLVRAIDQQFKQVGWFSVSALGRMPSPGDSRPFAPRGALAPMLWILARRDIRPSAEAAASSAAKLTSGTATDFRLPTPTARAWRAAAGALAASALIALPAIFAATQINFSSGAENLAYGGTVASSGDSSDSTSSGDSNGSKDSSGDSSGGSAKHAKTYPMMSTAHTSKVYAQPSTDSAIVGETDDSTNRVAIVCTARGDSVDGTNLWDRIEEPRGYVSDSAINTGTHKAVARRCGGSRSVGGAVTTHRRASAPAAALRRHYARLNDGDYQGAFSMFSPSYRSQNPGWPGDRESADPRINIMKIGSAHYSGGGAEVYILFYARDRNPSPNSDTKCRRFEGSAHLIRVGGRWRFDPHANQYSARLAPGNSRCRS